MQTLLYCSLLTYYKAPKNILLLSGSSSKKYADRVKRRATRVSNHLKSREYKKQRRDREP